jgi:hypothetical protein
MTSELWCVMDGRAYTDVHAAAIYEAYTERPSWRQLRRNWGDYGAVLVHMWGPSDDKLNSHEIVGPIDRKAKHDKD